MQPPSFGELLIPLSLSAVAVVTSLWAKGMKMSTRTALISYAVLLATLLGAYRYRLHEYEQWHSMERVVLKSHAGRLMARDGTGSVDMGARGYFRVANLTNKKIRITHFWLEGCAKDGKDLSIIGDGLLPKSLEPADDYEMSVNPADFECPDWLNRGRVRLTDGRVIRSVKDDSMPRAGN